MEVNLNKYYRCKVNKEVLKELSKKSDLKGFIHIIVFFSFLVTSGYLVFYTWPVEIHQYDMMILLEIYRTIRLVK